MTQATTLMDRVRGWLPLIPLLLLLAGTYWLNQQVQPLPPKQDKNKRHDIDYAVENFSAVTLDEKGQARYLLTSEKMWHYPDDDSTYLQGPRFVSVQNGRSPMVTSALSGKISSHGEDVFLSGEVKMVRIAQQAQDQMRFSTEYLHIDPDKDTADTDQAVVIETARDTVQAVGMRLDNKLRTIALLSNVRSTYEPIQK